MNSLETSSPKLLMQLIAFILRGMPCVSVREVNQCAMTLLRSCAAKDEAAIPAKPSARRVLACLYMRHDTDVDAT